MPASAAQASGSDGFAGGCTAAVALGANDIVYFPTFTGSSLRADVITMHSSMQRPR
jgi:hypothetical protein